MDEVAFGSIIILMRYVISEHINDAVWMRRLAGAMSPSTRRMRLL